MNNIDHQETTTKLFSYSLVENELENVLISLDEHLTSIKTMAKSRHYSHRVDGLIIGTGKADFTQGNTSYSLNMSDKTFELIDVPGIEGNESKYEAMVRQAVAKAHLVFYVNGTNKKPEHGTAEKITSYLKRGTKVCPLFNVRGNADSYEFEEDRESLGNSHVESGLKQTIGALKQCIGEDRLLEAYIVQGLLSFTALAKGAGKLTTIHKDRESDLVVQQRNFLKYFQSHDKMLDFSEIQAVADVVESRSETYREDIVESNKIKVTELLLENTTTLLELLKDYEDFNDKVRPQLAACKASIEDKFESFKQSLTRGRKNLIEAFFSNLTNTADDIIEDYFDDEDMIQRRIEKHSRDGQKDLEEKFLVYFDKCIEGLAEDLQVILTRLVEDVQRVDFQSKAITAESIDKFVFDSTEIDMGFDLKDFGKFAFNVGSYAVTGALIGTAFPGIGNIVGGIAGAVVGVLSTLLSVFTGKAKRIRKVQAKAQDKIDDARDKALSRIDSDLEKPIAEIHKGLVSLSLTQISILEKSLNKPIETINQQIDAMQNLHNKLKEMPHGTIQAI